MIALRETTQKLLDCQLHDGTDAEVELLQGKLKDQYKRFTAQYGLINSTANKRAFRQDSSYCLLASLEILDEDKTSSGWQIFYQAHHSQAGTCDLCGYAE